MALIYKSRIWIGVSNAFNYKLKPQPCVAVVGYYIMKSDMEESVFLFGAVRLSSESNIF